MVAMMIIVKRIDEKAQTTFAIMGQERRRTRELIDGGVRQLFNETNILLTGMGNMKGAINADFKKMSQFIADSNRFTYQKMDDISEQHNYRITKVIDRLIRIEYKQERQEVRALDLEKKLKQKKRARTPSMSEEAKRDILQKRQDRREAPGTPTESEVMSILDTPEPPELYLGEGDGRLAPHEDERMEEEDDEPETTKLMKNNTITQELWEQSTTKERRYFLLMVMLEAVCMYGDDEIRNDIMQQMQILASEVNEEAVRRMAGASGSQQQQAMAVENETQNVEECEEVES